MKKCIFILCFLFSLDGFCQPKWESVNTPVGSSILSITQSKGKSLYVAMQYSGIQYSPDLGNSWQYLNEGIPDQISQGAFLESAQNGSVFLANGKDLYVLIFRARNWKKIYSFNSNITKLFFDNEGYIICFTNRTQYISKDQGFSFNTFLKPNKYNISSLSAICAYDTGYLAASSNTRNISIYYIDKSGNVTDSLTTVASNVKNLFPIKDNKILISLIWSDKNNFIFDPVSLQMDTLRDESSRHIIHGEITKDLEGNFICINSNVEFSEDQGTNWYKNPDNIKLNTNFWPEIAILYNQYLFTVVSQTDKADQIYLYPDKYNNQHNTITSLKNIGVADILHLNTHQFIINTLNYDGAYKRNYFMTSDNGSTWQALDSVLDSTNIKTIQKNTNGELFILTYRGFYKTPDYFRSSQYMGTGGWYTFFIDSKNEFYFFGYNPYLLLELNSNLSDTNLVEVHPQGFDGFLNGMLFHPNGWNYLLWSNYSYCTQKTKHATYEEPYSAEWMRPPYTMNSKGDMYFVSKYLYTLDSNFQIVDSMGSFSSQAQICGIDNKDNIYVYDPSQGLIKCKDGTCDLFDMTGLPYPHIQIQHISSDINGDLYAGTVNGGLYQYTTSTASKNLEKLNPAFFVSPNPVCDFVSLSLATKSIDKLTYQLFNSIGVLVRTEQINNDVQEIDISSFPPGFYTIKIVGMGSTRLIKNEK